MDKNKILESLKRNRKKIWNIIRITYWTFILIVAMASMILLYSEFLST